MKKAFLLLGILMLNALYSAVYPQTDNQVLSDVNSQIIDRMDSIKVKVDSVKAEILLVTRNTESEKLLGTDIDWYNFTFAFLAFIVACFSAVYDFRGFRESKRTADNVARISYEVQLAQFNDLIRHLYRNIICTLAFTRKMLNTTKHVMYPSEEHLLKLKVLPEDFLHLDKYNDNNSVYQEMHELKLLFRNYDIEIDTAMAHLKDGKISIATLRNDLDTLTFKPLYLIKRILEVTEHMPRRNGTTGTSPFRNASSIIIKEHLKKLKEGKETFDIYNYLDLNIVNSEDKIEQPYDGLRRSRKILFSIAKGHDRLNHDDMFENNQTYHDYSSTIESIYTQDERFSPLMEEMASGKFEFKRHLLTILSIDVTIELAKIHMIKIHNQTSNSPRHKDNTNKNQQNKNI